MINSGTKKILLLAGVSAAAVCSATIALPALAQATPAAEDADTVVVTARRQALQSATDRKKNSDTLIDSVVADEAGKLPDASITEVLQRVSGVAIVRYSALGDPDHFSAEGSGVQVRGLSGVAGFLNGREVFSANGGRGLLWGDVTPELMSAVDVYKSSTADRLVGGTGGAIDLRTKMPFDYKKPAFQATLGASHGDLIKKTTPSGSFLITNRWDTPIGEIGALVDLAYSEYSARDNFIRMEPYYQTQVNGTERYIPGGYTYGVDNFNRERTGFYGAFQWRPSDNLTVYTTLFSSKYQSDNTGSGKFITSQVLTVDPTATNVFDENDAFVSGRLVTRSTTTGLPAPADISTGGNTGISTGTRQTSDWATGFDWRPSDTIKVSGSVQFVDSWSKVQNYDVFPRVPYPGSFSLDLSGELPQITTPASGQVKFDDPKQYYMEADMVHLESNHGTMAAANLDADFVLSDADWLRSVKVGVRHASRVERDNISGYNWKQICVGWNGCNNTPTGGHTFADADNPEDIALSAYDNFFRGEAALPANVLMPSGSLVAMYSPAYVRQQFGIGDDNPFAFLPTDYARGTTVTSELYVMGRFASETSVFGVPYSGNFGLRAVELENFAEGFLSSGATAARFNRNGTTYITVPSATANSGGRKTTRVLPSLNIAFAPSNEIKVRFAFNTTMDLPSFRDTRASGTRGVNTTADASPACPASANCPPLFNYFTSSTGNPNLKPMFSDNLDLSVEWYESRSFNAHFSVFHKNLKNLLIYGDTVKQVPFVYSAPTSQTVIEDVVSQEVFNSPENATIAGYEIGFRKFFDTLPEPFDGLGVETNYTYITSNNPGALALPIQNVRTTTRAAPGFVDSNPIRDLPVTGLSPHNWNMTVMYEKGPLSARVAYSWRSRYLMTTTGNGTSGTYTYRNFLNNTTQSRKINLPIYSENYGQIDLGATYRLNNNISLSLEASNITDAIPQTSMGGYPNGSRYTRSWFITDRRVNFSVRLSY